MLRTFPSASSFTRSNSRHPFSIVKILFSLGMVERIQLISVVLPLPVDPVTQIDKPNRSTAAKKSSISAVAVP